MKEFLRQWLDTSSKEELLAELEKRKDLSEFDKSMTNPTSPSSEQPTPSETPRTDAQEILDEADYELHREVGYPPFNNNGHNFARTLERENQTLRNAQKACESCDEPMKSDYLKLQRENQELREKLNQTT